MLLKFIKPYKSITGSVANEEIADFIVLSGSNGSGKSHLLEAINSGAIGVDDISSVSGPVPLGRRPSRPNRGLSSSSQVASVPIRIFRVGGLVAPIEQVQNSSTFRNTWAPIRDQFQVAMQALKAEFPMLNAGSEVFEQELTKRFLTGNSLTEEALGRMVAMAGKPLSEFTETDFRKHVPLLAGIRDPFKLTIAELFLNYHQRYVRNRLAQWLKSEGESEGELALTNDEFILQYGPAPWDLLNDVMANIGFDYKLNYPTGIDENLSYEVQLTHNTTGIQIPTSELSSGEKTLMTITMCFFAGSRLGESIELPRVLLLDEPDASLHPSMTRTLLRVIDDIFCRGYGVKVILATHSPSTVALAAEESLYVMRRAGDPRLTPAVSRDDALRELMVGLPTLSVKNENRRQVFVESDDDEGCYQELFRLLKDNLSTPFSLEFIASGKRGVGNDIAVKNLVQKLRSSGNLVQGIIDRDERSGAPEGIEYIRNRYTIENLILDPLLVGRLLLREDLIASENIFGESLRYREVQACHAQAICDYIAVQMYQDGDAEAKISVDYVGGFSASVPEYFLRMNGHKLEERYRAKFPVLNQYRGGLLKAKIIKFVIADMPDCAPQDVLELFRRLSS